MSADKISVAVLEEFIKKTRIALKSNQREIKITAQEADALVFNLNLILLRLLEKSQNNDTPAETQIVTVMMDGGGFDEKR